MTNAMTGRYGGSGVAHNFPSSLLGSVAGNKGEDEDEGEGLEVEETEDGQGVVCAEEEEELGINTVPDTEASMGCVSRRLA
jgi:hypothetical protein